MHKCGNRMALLQQRFINLSFSLLDASRSIAKSNRLRTTATQLQSGRNIKLEQGHRALRRLVHRSHWLSKCMRNTQWWLQEKPAVTSCLCARITSDNMNLSMYTDTKLQCHTGQWNCVSNQNSYQCLNFRKPNRTKQSKESICKLTEWVTGKLAQFFMFMHHLEGTN